MIQGDYVSIAGTTSGVSGTIGTVPIGAKIIGLNVNFKGDGGIISSIEIQATGWQRPMKITPKIANITTATNTVGISSAPSPVIDLTPYNLVAKSNTVTFIVTTTANETVVLGLMWMI